MERYKCKCSIDIKKEDVDFKNGTNEEGEEYCEFYFKCSSCGFEIETNQWGECTNSQNAIEMVSDKIQSMLISRKDVHSTKLNFIVLGAPGIGKSSSTI